MQNRESALKPLDTFGMFVMVLTFLCGTIVGYAIRPFIDPNAVEPQRTASRATEETLPPAAPTLPTQVREGYIRKFEGLYAEYRKLEQDIRSAPGGSRESEIAQWHQVLAWAELMNLYDRLDEMARSRVRDMHVNLPYDWEYSAMRDFSIFRDKDPEDWETEYIKELADRGLW